MISIIIPVYNAESKIERCLESLLRQTYKDIEILLINDGSKDRSIDILRKYEKQEEIIRVIDKENEGVAKTRNLGILKARGEYLMFVDNDDYLDEDYVETYYNAITETQEDIVVGGYRRVTENRTLFETTKEMSEWYKYTVVAPWAKIYRKKFIEDNKLQFLDYPIGEDVYFNLIAYQKTTRIKTINYIGYNWYFNEGSVSNTSQRGFTEKTDILPLLDRIYEEIGSQDKYIEYYYYRYVVWYLLFSGRESDSNTFMMHYKKYYQWLKQKNIRNRICFLSNQLNGETLVNRLATEMFHMFHCLKLVRLFAKIYCKK